MQVAFRPPMELSLSWLACSAPVDVPSGTDLTRYLVVCGSLIVLTGGLAWAFKRLVAGSLRARAARRSLQVIDVLPLGGKRQLSVVRCYDRTLVLGLGEREVRLVCELDAEAHEPETEAGFERLLEGARARLDRRSRARSGTEDRRALQGVRP